MDIIVVDFVEKIISFHAVVSPCVLPQVRILVVVVVMATTWWLWPLCFWGITERVWKLESIPIDNDLKVVYGQLLHLGWVWVILWKDIINSLMFLLKGLLQNVFFLAKYIECMCIYEKNCNLSVFIIKNSFFFFFFLGS